ncbi:hypothetical protein E4T56_gene433 [Termitomyces sp. T112]|nr:hypothetical protein E4T56_gene433 [Termitomyces sp. T112]
MARPLVITNTCRLRQAPPSPATTADVPGALQYSHTPPPSLPAPLLTEADPDITKALPKTLATIQPSA